MAVWIYGYMAPLRITRKVDKSIAQCGAGYAKIALHSPAVSRADGTGSVSSYRGQNILNLRVDTRTPAQAITIIDFLQGRIDEGYTAFQIYNVAERDTDATGSATTGMYWCQFLGDLTQVIQDSQKYDFVDLVFEEDLTAY